MMNTLPRPVELSHEDGFGRRLNRSNESIPTRLVSNWSRTAKSGYRLVAELL